MSLSACLSLPRARGGRRRLSNVFRAIQPCRLANDFRRGVRRENLVASLLAGETVSAASFRFSALHETVRPHFALQDMIDTLPPSSAHYALPVRSQGKRLRAGATVPGELNAKTQPGSADGWHEGCKPGSHTRAIIFKAAPMPYPAGA